MTLNEGAAPVGGVLAGAIVRHIALSTVPELCHSEPI